jgi:hypothetical protein
VISRTFGDGQSNKFIRAQWSSVDEPHRLRGPQFDAAYCDELAAWNCVDECWSMLQLGLRIGKRPRCVITTTPRSIKLLKDLIRREGQDVVVTRGTTFENADNLAPPFLQAIRDRYEGTTLGRQEIGAELLEYVSGALWSRATIEAARHTGPLPEMRRIVVSIDPAVSTGEQSDETGIILAGVGDDGLGYIIEDLSGRYAPQEWASKAVTAYYKHDADRIIGEKKQGGLMVEQTVRTIAPEVSFHAVHWSSDGEGRSEAPPELQLVVNRQLFLEKACSMELEDDEPRNKESSRHQNGLVYAQNLTTTSCSAPVSWVQGASSISEAFLKVFEEEPASPNAYGYKHQGEDLIQCSHVHITNGHKERAQKNDPGSRNRPLLPFQKPNFLKDSSTVYFFSIAQFAFFRTIHPALLSQSKVGTPTSHFRRISGNNADMMKSALLTQTRSARTLKMERGRTQEKLI